MLQRNKMFKVSITLLSTILLLSSCRKSQVSILDYPKEIASIAEGEDFVQRQEKDNIEYTSEYLPSDFLALREFAPESIKNGEVTKEKFASAKEKYSNAYYYRIKLRPKDGEDIIQNNSQNLEDYNRKQQYFIESIGKHVYVLTEKEDTIRTVTHLYARNFGMTPDVDFLVAFPLKLKEQDKFKIVFEDVVSTFPAKKIYFPYKASIFNQKLPEIKELK